MISIVPPTHSRLGIMRKAMGCGFILDQSQGARTVSRKMEGPRIFLLNLLAKTSCLAPSVVELSRASDSIQPGVSLLMNSHSFESQSPRLPISSPVQ